MSTLSSLIPGPGPDPAPLPLSPFFTAPLPGSPSLLISGADWPRWLDTGRAILTAATRATGLAARWAAGTATLPQRRGLLGWITGAAAKALGGLAGLLNAGKSTLAGWFGQTRDAIGAHHVAGAAALLATPDPADIEGPDQATLGGLVARQLDYLAGFRRDLIVGATLLGAAAEARAAMYGNAVWQVASNAWLGAAVRRGKVTEGRRALAASAVHCDVCIAEAARGWVPIGQVRPLGDSTCRSRCLCRIYVR